MDNLEEMEKFLKRYNLPRLTQEEPITSTEIETMIENSQETKVQNQMVHRQILSNI